MLQFKNTDFFGMLKIVQFQLVFNVGFICILSNIFLYTEIVYSVQYSNLVQCTVRFVLSTSSTWPLQTTTQHILYQREQKTSFCGEKRETAVGGKQQCEPLYLSYTLLEKFGRILLYLTDDAIVKFRQMKGNVTCTVQQFRHIELINSVISKIF